MDVTNWKDVDKFKLEHINCGIITNLTDDNKNTVTLTCPVHSMVVLATIPYRMFCMHIDKCAGRSSCPRNYACSE
jgi:hypothetical protein